MTMDEKYYTMIDCPQCGFEGSREISVKDDEIVELKLRVEQLTAELGDLPEAQAEMLTEIKRLNCELKNEYNRAIDDVARVFELVSDKEFVDFAEQIAQKIRTMKKV